MCEDEGNNWFAWMKQNDISGASWKVDQCTDTSCIPTSAAPIDGPWTDDVLTSDAGGTPVATGVQPPAGGGHGQFVVNWLRQQGYAAGLPRTDSAKPPPPAGEGPRPSSSTDDGG